MSEPLYVRVRRIVSANINDLVDSVESSQAEVVMKEAVREVERAIDDVRIELGKTAAKVHHAKRTIALTHARMEEMSSKAAFAVSEKRDDLAEAALSRHFDLEAQLPILNAAVEEANQEQAKLEEYVAALSGRKRQMEEDLKAFSDARSAAAADAGEVMAEPADRVRKADAAFERAMKGAGGPKVNAQSAETAAKIGEIEQISRNKAIAERLAILKKSA